ncbi:MAG: thioredoxin-disulfide reductase [Ignavibacteria bacterium GWF2_33_9]|nr:MAG: thioredoxin-disulfide reductase [Ignavibacteria bacterium GWF2_33_9]
MTENYQIVIIGTGPAGLTAAIYSARANRSTIVLEGPQPGGQLTQTTEVENYPGFADGIQGPEMMEIFRKQANRFNAATVFESAIDVDFSSRPFKIKSDADKEYTADAVIIATGASAKKLNIPSEHKFYGYGISGCATCDGFFYRGKKVFVVGGGDTAMEDALYLTHFAESVTLIHRRDEFRASKIMLDRVKEHPKISLMLDSVIDEFLGEEKMMMKSLTGVKIRNVKTKEVTEHQVDGVFLAIGHTPNTLLFQDVIETDDVGYIKTLGKSTYTNIEGVFACGDVQDPTYRQAITAAGSGCAASIDADRFLTEHSQ